MTWTINGMIFSELGLRDLRRSRQSLQSDIVTCLADGADCNAIALFPEDAEVVIKKGDTIWFTGRCVAVPRFGSPSEENNSFMFAGPWWYLENQIFKQQWKLYNSVSKTLELQYKSRVILGQKVNGTAQTISEALTEILNFAISNGAPLSIGSITPTGNIPMDEAIDITCAEAIRRLLRWVPDSACWFDYSSETPTFNCKRRSELTPVTFDLNLGAPNQELAIRSRTDLQVPAVVLRYEQVNVSDDIPYQSVTIDAYPSGCTGNELGSVNMTMQLAGSNLTMQTSEITVEELPSDLNDLTWWKSRLSELNDDSISNIVIHDADRVYAEELGDNLPNELIKGSIYPWMGGDVRPDEITAYVDYTILFKDESGVHQVIVNKLISYKYISTDLTSKIYKRTDSFTAGEAVPFGIAQAYYNSVNPLQYEGAVGLVENEVSSSVYPGMVLNIDNGQAEWTNMRALIHSVEEDVDNGITRISFGPPNYLGPADLIELHRANRGRKVPTSWKARGTGLSVDAASALVEFDAYTPDSKVHSEAGETQKSVFRDKGETYAAQISIDPTLVTAIKGDSDVELKPREIDVCVDGVPKKMIVLCSEPY